MGQLLLREPTGSDHPMFQYMGTNTRLNRLFNKAMAQQTMMVISKLLERFKGFDGISVLVDVGGGTGATLVMITSRYKHIRGINFDLPHALSEAPAIPGSLLEECGVLYPACDE